MFIQDRPFWIAHVDTQGITCKKMDADQLNAFIKRAQQFNPYREDEGNPKLRYLYSLTHYVSDRSSVKRIVNRGTDGYVGWKKTPYGTSYHGAYAVSFKSNKAARQVAERLQAELAALKEAAEAEALKEAEKKAKYTEKHLEDNRKVWMSSFLVDRYCGGDRYDTQITIGQLAAAERAYILDEDVDGGMQMFDLMAGMGFEQKSPLRAVLRLSKGKTKGIMTEEGYHVFSTSKVAASKARDKQIMKEALCDY